MDNPFHLPDFDQSVFDFSFYEGFGDDFTFAESTINDPPAPPGDNLEPNVLGLNVALPGAGPEALPEALPNGIYVQPRQTARGMEHVRIKYCPDCSKEVNLGPGTSEHAYLVHRSSKACLRAQQGASAKSASATPAGSLPDLDLPPPPTTPTAATPKLIPSSQTCPGAVLRFTRSVYTDYPWQLHESRQMPYRILAIGEDGFSLTVRSTNCTGFPMGDLVSCVPCTHTDELKDVSVLKQRIESTPSLYTNFRFLSFTQLVALLEDKNKMINDLKIKVSVILSIFSPS